MNLKTTLIVATLLSSISIFCWEYYWRAQGNYPNLDDNNALWASQRAKIISLEKVDVILLGSSRVLFDIQLDEWETATGKRPIQLASAGTTPLPAFRDIVDNTNFNGTLIVGVTPGLFFSTTFPEEPPWRSIKERIDYFEDRTYAQNLNHYLSLPLQNNFAFISEVEGVDGINLKQLLKKVKIGTRIEEGMPPFHEFSDISIDRNTKMTERTVTDTAFANTIKNIWRFFDKDPHPPEKEATIAFFLEDVQKFKARGGNLILVRCPSTGFYKTIESEFFPRTEFWNELLKQAKVKGYHYADYPQLSQFDCPEWSHLSAKDAAIFTIELTKIMIDDNALTNPKTN